MSDAGPVKIALTGSIAMGKSTAAKMFAEFGLPVFDADAETHRLYEPGGEAVAPISKSFPGVVVNGRVDRKLLSARVLNNADEIKKLEGIVHPLVRAAQIEFLKAASAEKKSHVVFDIPLLFETGRDSEFDIIIVVSAPAELQKQRALARDGMTEEKFKTILARQMPDEEKRKRADYVISSAISLDDMRNQLHDYLTKAGVVTKAEKDA